jgi:hypothetical protein
MSSQMGSQGNRGWDDWGDRWGHLSYRVRVRATEGNVYLWGSTTITSAPITFTDPVLLHIRNDERGESVTLWTATSGNANEIGTLSPGECVSIPVNGVNGVYAVCATSTTETTVNCVIKR